ncbi:MAG TPA: TauD/TfdA family dioxygenase [Rhodospirillaceae bacterium]|nr:taurine catabolism dioxygenase [Rhodospirillaceae bacterium]HAA91692.1 TauD/TfdA family dioxygenase [Rhodospirillaceae bacterium]HAT34752.1 TauD/TfdA family dioxygenase [Rhodospirillaceae bacterium]
MKVNPFDAPLGAEVTDIDLAADLDAETVEALNAAWAEHLVLCVRDQDLSPPDFLKAGRIFGDPFEQLYGQFNHPDYPDIGLLTHKDGDTAGSGKRKIRGTSWHTDASYFEHPPAGTMLFALVVPEGGGDTDFMSTRAAYESMSTEMKAKLEGLNAMHVYESSRSPRKLIKRTQDQVDKFGEQMAHPIVRTHPANGLKSIFLNPIRVECIDGMDRAESDALLDDIQDHLFQPQFHYRHKWRVGDFLIWDNRSILHQANDDYDWRSQQRKLYRIMTKGERPV